MGRKKPILLIFCLPFFPPRRAHSMTCSWSCEQYDVKQETVHCYPGKTREILTAIALDQGVQLKVAWCVAGISARFDPFVLQNNKSSNLKNCETKFTVPLGTSHEVLIEIIDFFAILFETYHCGNFEFSLWIYFNLQFMATKNDSTASKRRYQVGLMTPPYG